ncbi:MAG TPA: hypothetical protein VK666_23610 [Chryseolinea sp.]|nr:hypothetical protein [Chryseolinea sp.]
MRSLQIILAGVWAVFCWSACTRPSHIDSIPKENETAPQVTAVTLKDTLPAQMNKAIENLNLGNVMGIQLRYPSGRAASYFVYHAEKNATLMAISRLPFSKNAGVADAACRPMDGAEWTALRAQASPSELNAAEFFWDADPNDYVAYECLKTPMRHTLLVNKHTDEIIHRIEVAG